MDSKKNETFIRNNEHWKARPTELEKELMEMNSAVETAKKSDEKIEKKFMPKLSTTYENGSTVVNFDEYKLNRRSNTG
uniref:Conserved domain protein n=1 Tax=Strongyloides venezuelensis TaxID=75913 RepID=A0A0K0FRS4_STRVS